MMSGGGRAAPYSRVNELNNKGARSTKVRSAVKTHNFYSPRERTPYSFVWEIMVASNLLLFSTILGLGLANSSKKTLRIRQLQRVILR